MSMFRNLPKLLKRLKVPLRFLHLHKDYPRLVEFEPDNGPREIYKLDDFAQGDVEGRDIFGGHEKGWSPYR